jgi:hypothetical protein
MSAMNVGGAAVSAPGAVPSAEPDPAARADDDPVTYEAGWDSTADTDVVLLNLVVYVWWFFIGGAFQVLFGGMYLGSTQAAQIHVTSDWALLGYAIIGAFMVTLGFGLLRLERWTYWGGWLASAAILVIAVIELVRWATGTPITLESAFFAALDILFVLINAYLLSLPATRELLHYPPFKGAPFAPGMALSGIALGTWALTIALFVNHVDKRLSDPVLALIYLLGSVLVIVMAVIGLRVRTWVWWADLTLAALLAALSIYVIVDQLTTSGSVDTQGLILSGVCLVFVAIVGYLLLLSDVRAAVFGAAKQALFSPPTLIGGLSLAVLALVVYLLPGQLGKPVISYTVLGLAMGAVVGLIPGADPANRISAYFAGLLLAFASYVVRGGLLPYTKGSSAVVVLLMLLVVTGITAVVRRRAWFVLMLLGVATMYGTVEPAFQAAPTTYIALAGLAFVGILLGFGLGFTVSSLLELELVPYKPTPARALQASAAAGAPSQGQATGTTQPERNGR